MSMRSSGWAGCPARALLTQLIVPASGEPCLTEQPLLDRLNADRGAVGAHLDARVGVLGGLEAERDHGIGAASFRLGRQSCQRLATALVQQLSDAFEFATCDGLERGREVGADVPRPHGETEDLAEHRGDLVPGNIIAGYI